MSATTEAESTLLNELETQMHGYMGRLFERWKHRVYFLEGGKTRLGSVAGYILGLAHSGQVAFAKELAEDLDRNFNNLSRSGNNYEYKFSLDETERSVSVPVQKCVVGDDGTWHGFGLTWYGLLSPELYEEKLAYFQQEINHERTQKKAVYDTAHMRVVKELKIREKLDPQAVYSEEFTETRYLGHDFKKFYYIPHYNGGLLYHGPGAGETFAINISTRRTLWSIHT
jgi:hypothetical protein